VVTREEYRRMEGFIGERDIVAPTGEPLVRYVLVNFALLGAGLAAWMAVIAGLIWMLF